MSSDMSVILLPVAVVTLSGFIQTYMMSAAFVQIKLHFTFQEHIFCRMNFILYDFRFPERCW
jgi:hypothetical protein